MELKEQTYGAVTAVRPDGPVTGENAQRLAERLLEVRKRSLGRLVLDLSAVPFVDSRTLEAMLDVTEAMSESGQVLKLCGLNDVLREVLELTSLAPAFEHFDDVNSAVRSFL